MKEKNLTEKAFTLLSEKILDHEAISRYVNYPGTMGSLLSVFLNVQTF